MKSQATQGTLFHVDLNGFIDCNIQIFLNIRCAVQTIATPSTCLRLDLADPQVVLPLGRPCPSESTDPPGRRSQALSLSQSTSHKGLTSWHKLVVPGGRHQHSSDGTAVVVAWTVCCPKGQVPGIIVSTQLVPISLSRNSFITSCIL